MQFNFGKYAGRSIADVLRTADGKKYARWVVENVSNRPAIVSYINDLLADTPPPQRGATERRVQPRPERARRQLRLIADYDEQEERKYTFVAVTVKVGKYYKQRDGSWSKLYTENETYNLPLKTTDARIEQEIYSALDRLLTDDSAVAINTFDVVSWQDVELAPVAAAAAPIAAMPMRRARVLKYDFIPSNFDEKTYKAREQDEHLKGQDIGCVCRALFHRYKPTMPSLTIESLMWFFENGDDRLASMAYIDQICGKNTTQHVPSVTPEQVLRWCKKHNISMYGFDLRQQMFVKNVAERARTHMHPTLVFYAVDEHMYLVEDKELIKSVAMKYAERLTSSAIFRNHGDAEPKAYEHIVGTAYTSEELWEMTRTGTGDLWPELEAIAELKPNTLLIVQVDDLRDLWYEIFEVQGRICGVRNNEYKISEIVYDKKNNVVIATDPNLKSRTSWKEVQAICAKVGIPFKNQYIGGLVEQAREKFFLDKSGRVVLSRDERQKIMEEQLGMCGVCKDELTRYDIDHIKPLSAGGTNERSNLQALCTDCHREKTERERDNGGHVRHDDTKSSFCKQMREVFTSDLGKAWAFIEAAKGDTRERLHHIDIVKCRRNILLTSKYDYPQYSVYDQVEPFDGSLSCGRYYIEADAESMPWGGKPLRGNGWYSLPMVEYCLQQKIITTEQIKYQAKPSLTVAHDHFNEFIQHVVDTFGDVAKVAVNAMVGCFNRYETKNIRMLPPTRSMSEAGTHFLDVNGSFIRKGPGDLFELFYETNSEVQETNRPLYLQILDIEAVELHKLMEYVRAHGGMEHGLNTDCVSFYMPDKQRCDIPLCNVFWDDACTIRKYQYEHGKPPMRRGRKDGYVRAEKYTLEPLKWTSYVDTLENRGDLVAEIVASEKGLLLTGEAGSGKTTTLHMLYDALKLAGKSFVSLAPTNVAALLLEDGQTIDHFVNAHMGTAASINKRAKGLDYVIVDEISMVKEPHIKALTVLKSMHPKLKVVLAGDYSQYEPVCDRIHYHPGFDHKNRQALKELTDGQRLELTYFVRSGEKIDYIRAERDAFGTAETYRNIVYTNEMRKLVNDRCMRRFLSQRAKTKGVELLKTEHDPQSQDVRICAGMPIIARVTRKQYNICKNQFFTIVRVQEKTKEVFVNDNEGGDELTIPLDEFQALFYLAFAVTSHKCQGATFREPYTVWEWDTWFLKQYRGRYVVLSRASERGLVNIAPVKLEAKVMTTKKK